MATETKSALKIVFGAMTLGKPGELRINLQLPYLKSTAS